MVTRTNKPARPPEPRSLRRVASRSAALLRDALDAGRVVAWLCQRCGHWVPPTRFSAASGLCRMCTDRLNQAG
jgi:hypothetical protein